MITVAGLAPSLDITYLVDDLRLGEIHRPTQVVAVAGGKPLNCARAAHRLGADVAVVAILGGPTGAVLRSELESEGIRVQTVATPVESRTCVSIASRSTGELTEVYPYAEPISDVWAAFRTELTTALTRGGWLVISGGAPRELPPDALAELVAIGHDAGCRVAVDTHGAALSAAVDARPALVKINRYEAAELLGRPATDDLPSMIESVRQRSGGLVVITDGDRGALAGDGTELLRVELPKVRGHFPVGSGDSFLAGLIAELDSGGDLRSAITTATAAGAANALEPGPGRFEIETVQRLRPQVLISA